MIGRLRHFRIIHFLIAPTIDNHIYLLNSKFKNILLYTLALVNIKRSLFYSVCYIYCYFITYVLILIIILLILIIQNHQRDLHLPIPPLNLSINYCLIIRSSNSHSFDKLIQIIEQESIGWPNVHIAIYNSSLQDEIFFNYDYPIIQTSSDDYTLNSLLNINAKFINRSKVNLDYSLALEYCYSTKISIKSKCTTIMKPFDYTITLEENVILTKNIFHKIEQTVMMYGICHQWLAWTLFHDNNHLSHQLYKHGDRYKHKIHRKAFIWCNLQLPAFIAYIRLKHRLQSFDDNIRNYIEQFSFKIYVTVPNLVEEVKEENVIINEKFILNRKRNDGKCALIIIMKHPLLNF
ncbi:unnamed protein product [Didymodactylos carnosus]|uniref:Uncharacterized protein n=1 Tax=Didymodactylos carnosus TaxID=1234261 RepID=A0A815MVT3_9BILA|nr:unnamed protein product [Didymodactylos carnosus]CAF1429872.1 unnamed protein product [Didymodactylos carnosus]CAF3823480.1 unnamed protein product [Didymodactylos carnosus]CAF4308967.1 unnamed protein product [Didymodactylos carnosus]